MIKKQPLVPERVRKIQGSFAFIEHRFLRFGFWENLTHHELVLYLSARQPAAGHDMAGKDPTAAYNLISDCLSAQKSRQI